MTEPTLPTKKEMLEWLDNCSSRESCAGCEEFKGDCGYVVDAIRKLIDAMPEPITLENASRIADETAAKLAESRKVKPEDLTRPITGGSIPSSPAMTDEEAVDVLNLMGNCGLCQQSPSCERKSRALTAEDYLRDRLASKPKVTREQAETIALYLWNFIPPGKVKSEIVPHVLSVLGLEVEDN